jgi:hypothetical protein
MNWFLMTLWLASSLTLPFAQLAQQEEDPLRAATVESYHNRQVTVRGFLYQTPDNRWVLSSEPNLKSCCIGTGERRARQILLPPDLLGLITQQPVTVKGVALPSSSYLLELKEATVDESSPHTAWVYTGVVLLLSFSAVLLFKKKH